MQRAFAAVLAALLLSVAAPATPVDAASDAKVVVVVGPVGSSTAHYKDDARQIVAEAKRWTSNVVKVFTPDATWSRVKAAAQGASVFVYLGHGNGWPSKYAPFQTLTKNGLGLDPASGADSTRTVYYGEEYLRNDIRLAPNAVVLLYHLCYASGNTEPGLPVGTFSDSRERVDNYGAGFIGAGARAVIAEGHPTHPVTDAIRQLFTTNRSMQSIFRNAPTNNGNHLGPYPAQRTPGLEYLLDPDTSAPSGFYRSIIGDLSLTAGAVVGPPPARTDVAPPELVVPGAAEVTAPDGAGIWARADNAADLSRTAPDTLPAGTTLRLTSEEAAAADGTRVLGVKVLGGSTTGYVRATDLSPRDSESVAAISLDESAAWLSPNGDGTNDALVVAARFTERASAVLTVKDAAGATVRTLSVTDELARLAWDLRNRSGDRIPDGRYTWSLRAVDAWGNPPFRASGAFTVDGTAPVTKAAVDAETGSGDWLVTSPTVTLTARDALSGVRTVTWRLDGGRSRTYGAPAVVTADGTVRFEYRAIDNAGIREGWRSLVLRVDTTPPTIGLPMSGKAGDATATWRGPVTVSPVIKDAASGVAARRFSVDGGDTAPLGTDPIVVTGDGRHTVTVIARDEAGHRTTATTTFTIDTVKPTVELPDGATVPTITPNGDGIGEQTTVPVVASEAATLGVTITGPDGSVARTLSLPVAAGRGAVSWDGRDAAGTPVPDGRYAVTVVARDLAGNTGPAASAEVDVYAALAGLTRSPALFHPGDGDALAAKAVASWTLQSPAGVTIRVLDAAGRTVRSGPTDRAFAAGAARWTWNGRDDAGAFVAPGVYRIVVAASNGTQGASLSVGVRADAFRLVTSAAEAARGTKLVVTATSAEPLAGAPRLVVRQPGLAAWSVTMTRLSGSRWTATITPRRGGTAGTLQLVVKATDVDGGRNVSSLRLPLD